jgi:hypothetical protein
MPDFIPGLELCRQFYQQAVRPVLDAEFPDLPHSAALIGTGSEVLGFDTAMSADHDWGPRVLLFLRDNDCDRCADALQEALRQRLPRRFCGYRTDFRLPEPEPPDAGSGGPVAHSVETLTLRGFFRSYLGFDLDREIEPADWLTFPQQKLRAITTGAVYHDGIALQAVRDRFAWYPRDVWLYLLAAGWTRIGQEEHLMPRAGFVGDEIGSALIGARLVRDLMLLSFLMERQYAPYPKWFGTAFQQLACAGKLSPHLQGVLRAETWPERERHLCAAYEIVAAMHNALGMTEPLPAQVSPFFTRPFKVIQGGAFAVSIRARITDPDVQRLAARRLIGSIDQWSDSTDMLCDLEQRPVLRRLYEPAADADRSAAASEEAL